MGPSKVRKSDLTFLMLICAYQNCIFLKGLGESFPVMHGLLRADYQMLHFALGRLCRLVSITKRGEQA